MEARRCITVVLIALLVAGPAGAQELSVAQDEFAAMSVAFSTDGTMLGAISSGKVKVWRIDSGEPVPALSGSGDGPLALAFSPNGTLFAVGDVTGAVTIFDLNGNLLRTLHGHTDFVRDVTFSPAGGILASASDDGTVLLWDVASGEQIEAFEGHPGYVRTVAFAPDGQLVVTGCDDGVVRLWDAGNGTLLRELRGHGDYVRDVAISPDGAVIASASDDSTVRLWDALTGEELTVLRGHNDWVRGVAFSPDGSILASAADDGAVHLWDLRSREIRSTLAGPAWFISVAFSPDGTRLATSDTGGMIRLWNPATGELVASASGRSPMLLSMDISPDRRLLAAGSNSGDLHVWDTTNLDAGPRTIPVANVMSVLTVAFNGDGTLLAAAGEGSEVLVVDVASGRVVHTIEPPPQPVALYLDGQNRLWAVGWGGSVNAWNLANGEMVRNFGAPGHGVSALDTASGSVKGSSWSAEGTQSAIFVDGGNTVILGSGENGALCMALSPDGRLLATGSRWGTVQIGRRDALDGTALAGAAHSDYVRGVAFSPDGTLLASGSDDGTVKIWSVAERMLLHTAVGHEDWVRAVHFIDNERVASCADDGTVRIWNARTGEEQRKLDALGHDAATLAAPR
jgi:WD40 repeat protein